MKPIQVLFSAYYWIVVFIWLAVLCIASSFVKMLFGYSHAYRWVVCPGFKICLYLGLNRFRVRYHPNFDPQKPYVFCQNHINVLDAFVAGSAIPQAFCGVMHAWQFKIPIYGWLMSITEGISIDPKSKGNLTHLIASAQKRMEHGLSILTFPEGTRTPDGNVHSFRTGAFLMAKQAGYPVVPIAVLGLFSINHKATKLFSPFRIIDIYVGEPVDLTHRDELEIKDVAREFHDHIAKVVESGNSFTSA